MRRRALAPAVIATSVIGLSMVACGGSNSSSSSGSNGGSSPTATIQVGGGSFCDKTRSVIAQVSQLGKTLTPVTAGATPDVNGFKQLIATIASAVDALDGSAPGEIAPAFHTFRAAYDDASSKVQGATSFEQVTTALSSIDSTAVKSAGDQISSYLKTTCGINPSPAP